VSITPNGAFAYVANQGFDLETQTVAVIATSMNKVVTTIPMLDQPIDVAITADGGFAYVTTISPTNFAGTVSVIATATNTVVARIPVGLQPFGLAITPPTGAVLSVSVTPNSGSGASQTFAFQYSDSTGFGSLTYAYAGFGPTAYAEHSCRVKYVSAGNQLFLKNDDGTAFMGPVTPGLAGTLSNSQCTLDASASSRSGSGDILMLNLAFTFTTAFAGKQGIFMYAIDKSGVKTPGREHVGTWTVP
jgi:YVTN family beta-propeller protein